MIPIIYPYNGNHLGQEFPTNKALSAPNLLHLNALAFGNVNHSFHSDENLNSICRE